MRNHTTHPAGRMLLHYHVNQHRAAHLSTITRMSTHADMYAARSHAETLAHDAAGVMDGGRVVDPDPDVRSVLDEYGPRLSFRVAACYCAAGAAKVRAAA